VLDLADTAVYGEKTVREFLTKPGITYDKREKIYIVDPDNLQWENIR